MGGSAPPYRVRRLGPADAGPYRAVRLDSLRIAPDSFSTQWEDEQRRPPSHFAEQLGRANAVGAVIDGLIVGVARLHDGTGSPEQGTINGVFVYPEHRGRGIGQALLGALLARADERRMQVSLTVAAANEAAIALYRRVGFHAARSEPGAHGTADLMRMIRQPAAARPDG